MKQTVNATKRQIGSLRIAKVTYEHFPLYAGEVTTIGGMVDDHIATVLNNGGLISEVTLAFETPLGEQL